MQKTLAFITSLLILSITLPAQAVSDTELQQAAAEINKQTPMELEEGVRLDSASSGKQKLIYNYTLLKYSSSELDSAKFKSTMRPTLLKVGCQTLKPLLSEGVTVNYIYKGNDAAVISNISVTPGDCGF